MPKGNAEAIGQQLGQVAGKSAQQHHTTQKHRQQEHTKQQQTPNHRHSQCLFQGQGAHNHHVNHIHPHCQHKEHQGKTHTRPQIFTEGVEIILIGSLLLEADTLHRAVIQRSGGRTNSHQGQAGQHPQQTEHNHIENAGGPAENEGVGVEKSIHCLRSIFKYSITIPYSPVSCNDCRMRKNLV